MGLSSVLSAQNARFIAYYGLISLPFVLVGLVVYRRFFAPYANVPGPFWASITRFWYVRQIKNGDMEKTTKALHAKYGPIVRIAPNEVSIADPEALKVIYNIKSGFVKTDFYDPWGPKFSPHGDLFTQKNEKVHTERRRLVNNLYSMTSILESEKFIDGCSSLFFDAMGDFADEKQSVDIGEWFQMYAFDVIGELFFGKRFGFLDERSDWGTYIKTLDILLPIFCMISVSSAYTRPFQMVYAILIPHVRNALTCFNNISVFSKKAVDDRAKVGKKLERPDILTKLFKLHEERPKDFGMNDIYTESFVSIFAGSDTTAIALRSCIYCLCKNRTFYDKVVAEINEADKAGQLSTPIRYNEAIKLPYLQAVCKEAMRYHPSVALTVGRHVPPGGATIAGRFFPPGSRVGVSAPVIHNNKDIFGPDADQFNPERWFREDAQNMDRYLFTFGAGTRTCVGKNISLSEIHKLIPEFLRRFNIKLTNANAEWTTNNAWFHKQSGIMVDLERRTPKVVTEKA